MKNANKIVADWILTNNFHDAVEELNGDFDTVPVEVYEAWYSLKEKEKLQTYQEALKILIPRIDY